MPDAARPRLGRHHGFTPDHPVVAHWQALVDRRLIGSPPPRDSALAAAVRAAEAVLLRGRRQAGAVR